MLVFCLLGSEVYFSNEFFFVFYCNGSNHEYPPGNKLCEGSLAKRAMHSGRGHTASLRPAARWPKAPGTIFRKDPLFRARWNPAQQARGRPAEPRARRQAGARCPAPSGEKVDPDAETLPASSAQDLKATCSPANGAVDGAGLGRPRGGSVASRHEWAADVRGRRVAQLPRFPQIDRSGHCCQLRSAAL